MPILDDILKGLKKGAEKASDAIKTLEINRKISRLESSIADKKLKIGELVYVQFTDKK